jgi:hypothetical protein
MPYGAHESGQVYTDWLAERGLHYVPNALCLHWISEGRCPEGSCRRNRDSYAWCDHMSGYKDKDGNRFLICQPYILDEEGCRQIFEVANEFDLDVMLHGAGWYRNGTVYIEFEPRAQQKARGEKEKAERRAQRASPVGLP